MTKKQILKTLDSIPDYEFRIALPLNGKPDLWLHYKWMERTIRDLCKPSKKTK